MTSTPGGSVKCSPRGRQPLVSRGVAASAGAARGRLGGGAGAEGTGRPTKSPIPISPDAGIRTGVQNGRSAYVAAPGGERSAGSRSARKALWLDAYSGCAAAVAASHRQRALEGPGAWWLLSRGGGRESSTPRSWKAQALGAGVVAAPDDEQPSWRRDSDAPISGEAAA